MSSKQDRQGARTASDLERKYNFGETFAEFMGLADDAKRAAEEAKNAADNANGAVGSLDQETIFNLLTNNGEAQGIFRDENGQLYINASYLASGIITSADGSVRIDLGSNTVTIDTRDEENGGAGRLELSSSGIKGFGYNPVTQEHTPTLHFLPGGFHEDGTTYSAFLTSYRVGLILAANDEDKTTLLGSTHNFTEIRGSEIGLDGKIISWKDNGDGTYTLIGQ